jgi:DNA-binding NarL/FixJ family response regulator
VVDRRGPGQPVRRRPAGAPDGRPGRVAGLAAAGLSNRAIAERLVVSVRTVDNHLQHVFDKLGIRSRQELSRFMGDHNQAATVE